MRIAEKVAIGKSADISQNVRLDELFQNIKKKVTRDFSDLFEVLQVHCDQHTFHIKIHWIFCLLLLFSKTLGI